MIKIVFLQKTKLYKDMNRQFIEVQVKVHKITHTHIYLLLEKLQTKAAKM